MEYRAILFISMVILHVEADGEQSLLVDIYPGYGWDALQAMDMSPLFDLSNFNNSLKFQSCIQLIPVYNNRIDLDSTVIDMFDARSSDFSSNLFVGGGGGFWKFRIQSSFSEEYQRSKKQQGEEHTIALRNQIEYIMCDVVLQSSCPLNPLVRKALIDIANYQINNESTMAKYAAQLFIKTYGTHFTNRLSLGGSIVQEDHIKKSTYYEDSSRTQKYRVAASASFLFAFDISTSYQWGTMDRNITNETKQFSRKTVRARGGQLNLSRGAIDSWQATIDGKPAVIRRAIENLTSLIQSAQIPELSELQLKNVRDEVNAAINTYVELNVYKGCMNRTSPSFNWAANVDDGACVPAEENSQFGGFFRTCTEGARLSPKCEQFRVRNFYTNAEECPPNFNRSLLRHSVQVETIFKQECHRCGFLWLRTCCHDLADGVGQRTVDFFACNSRTNKVRSSANGALTIANEYVYGGSFTSTKVNPVTGFQGCPSEQFQAARALDDLQVCLSERTTDMDGLPHYGGVYSCEQGNTAFANLSQECPSGYSVYVMSPIDESCLLYVCLKFEKFPENRQLPAIVLPPFFAVSLPNHTVNIPIFMMNKTDGATPPPSTQGSSNFPFVWFMVSLCLNVLLIAAVIFIRIKNGHGNRQGNPNGYMLIE